MTRFSLPALPLSGASHDALVGFEQCPAVETVSAHYYDYARDMEDRVHNVFGGKDRKYVKEE